MSGPASHPHLPQRANPASRRLLFICVLAFVIALGAALLAEVLVAPHRADHQPRLLRPALASTSRSPADNHARRLGDRRPGDRRLIVGVMARYGSPAIRGHGIPEAMERVLIEREPHPAARMTLLKPLVRRHRDRHRRPVRRRGPDHRDRRRARLAAGQLLQITADERKTLLAAGAAAGMAAMFGTPVAAVLLAIELLLFEYRAALAHSRWRCASADRGRDRDGLHGAAPVFPMPDHRAARRGGARRLHRARRA